MTKIEYIKYLYNEQQKNYNDMLLCERIRKNAYYNMKRLEKCIKKINMEV